MSTVKRIEIGGITGWLLPALILAGWEAAARAGLISANVLPAPSAVAEAFWRLLLSGELVANIGVSSARALAGFAIGGSIGFIFGLANGLSKFSRSFTDTTLQMIRNIPHLALIPLVILWFGIDEGAKVLLVGWGVFFPLYLNTYHGVTSVDHALIEMGRVYGMGRWTLFRRVILPGALPSILVGLRFALGIMWLTLIVAETISSSSGSTKAPIGAAKNRRPSAFSRTFATRARIPWQNSCTTMAIASAAIP